MEPSDRLKTYQTFAEVGRKWSQVMDAKASFLATLNLALIGFLWTGAKLADGKGCASYLGILGTAIALLSLYIVLKSVFPKTTLKQTYGDELEYAKGYVAVSFFGEVARNYPNDKHGKFIDLVNSMSEDDFAREALEQHYTISHVVLKKSEGISHAARLWFWAVLVTVAALIVRGLYGI